MKKLFAVMLCLALLALCACGKEKPMEFTTDFALPMRTLETARPLLRNPDRGLRMETYITLTPEGAPESYPGNLENPCEKMLGFIEKYEEESPVIVQLYIYLTRFNDKPLNDHAFEQLRQMLELLRDNGIRTLMRFAYQNESNPDPGWPCVEGHLHQISEWFGANDRLIEDTLFAMQGGIVGYWGEGHGSINFEGKFTGPAFDLLCDITPADVFVQLRNIDQMNRVSHRHKDRLGMHDDYIIGERNGAWSFFLGKRNRRTRQLEEHFKHTVNDAEMPWGIATYYDREDGRPLDSLGIVAVLEQVKQYSLTTLSLEHNYRETGPERVFSMACWRNEVLTMAQLETAGLPYHPALFDENGTISAFAYVQYHLGYLLSITSFEVDDEQIRFTIQNNGFAAPLNFNALSLVIDGEEYPVGSYDKYALGSMQAVRYIVDLPEGYDAAQAHSVGVKLARHAGSVLCARFMNDTAFRDGVQEITP